MTAIRHRFRSAPISCAISWCILFIFMLNLANFAAALCNALSENCSRNYANESTTSTVHGIGAGAGAGDETCSIESDPMIFSQALEDYVLSQSSLDGGGAGDAGGGVEVAAKSRTSKDLPYMRMDGPMSDAPTQPLSYHSSAYPPMQQSMAQQSQRPGPGGYIITKRIGEASMELEAHMRPPVKVVNPQFRPMTNQMLHHPQQQQIQQQQQQQQQQPSFLQQLFGIGGGSPIAATTQSPPAPPMHQMRPVPLQQHTPQQQQHQQHLQQQQPFRVSENDLYLLGAIEKLVFRVDYLESRIRRAEQLLYYLAGNNKKEGITGPGPAVRDPCPTNFTRISDNCYYINSNHQVNWKTANAECKKTGAHLAEFEKVSENEEIMAYLLNQPQHRGRDYWLGGLNPGLLWIWSNSAKPVNPNMNLTSIAMKHNSTATAGTTKADATQTNLIEDEQRKDDKEANRVDSGVLSNAMEIGGKGRCLKIAYHPTKHTYVYYGEECTTRNPYICEYEDKTLDNKIKKITRDLKLFTD